MSETQPMSENQIDKESASEPLSQFKMASQVAPKKRSRIIIGGLTLFVVVLFLCVVLSSHSSSKPETAGTTSYIPNNSEALQQNEEKLRQWQLGQSQMNSHVEVQPLVHPSNKTMQARFNAPTQLYAAMPEEDSTNQSTNSNSSNTVLVGNNHFAQFANSQGNSVAVVTGTTVSHPSYTIAEGEFIQAVLETAINSDLPGMVRAVITQPVYSFKGERLLIPAGSRLVGQYTSMASNAAATTRVFVVWNRILTPNGVSMLINSPGTDALGTAGMGADVVDTHFWQLFGSASLLSVLGASSANVGVSSDTQANSANLYQQSIANAFQQSAQNSLGQNLNIQPTLHSNQGDAVTVFVANDIDLYSVLGGADKSAHSTNNDDWKFLS